MDGTAVAAIAGVAVALINTLGLVALAIVNARVKGSVDETKRIVNDPETGVVATHKVVNSQLSETKLALAMMTERMTILTAKLAAADSDKTSAARSADENLRTVTTGMALAAAAYPPQPRPGNTRASDAAAKGTVKDALHPDASAATPPVGQQPDADKKTFLVETAEVEPGSEITPPNKDAP